MKKDDIVEFIGIHPVLITNKEYKVVSASETGVQVITPTGYAGVPIKDVILVKIKG